MSLPRILFLALLTDIMRLHVLFFNGRWIVSDIGSRWHKTWKLFSSNAQSFEGQSVVAYTLWSGAPCLEVVPGLVLWFGGSEVILQEGLQILKGGPLLGVPLPALEHELVQGAGTVLGAGHPVTTLDLLQDFSVVHAWGTNAKHVLFNWKKTSWGALKFLYDAELHFIHVCKLLKEKLAQKVKVKNQCCFGPHRLLYIVWTKTV